MSRRFNFYLLAAVCAALLCGCSSTKKKAPESTLRVHAEASSSTAFTRKITLFEHSPVELTVDQSPLLSEGEVESAAVVDTLGGYGLMIKFDKRGQWLLDQHSSLNRGRHLAIFVQFSEKPVKAVWLAAPIISNRISDGTLLFTPDATREDAELIAQGLSKKDSKKAAKDDKW